VACEGKHLLSPVPFRESGESGLCELFPVKTEPVEALPLSPDEVVGMAHLGTTLAAVDSAHCEGAGTLSV
jgi:hypothetical protein